MFQFLLQLPTRFGTLFAVRLPGTMQEGNVAIDILQWPPSCLLSRCDIYPRGEDHTSVVIPCVFSQRQGYITIDRTDGVTHDLAPGDNYTAPYSTKKFDATARISCILSGQGKTDKGGCAIGIKRGPKQGQAIIAIMRPDGVERVLKFDGEQVVSPGEGKVRAWRQSDEWEISIDDRETYRIPLAAVEGG